MAACVQPGDCDPPAPRPGPRSSPEAASPPLLRQGEEGAPLPLGGERARSIPKQRIRNMPAGRQAGFCGQELAGLGFVPRGGGRSQALQQSGRQGAGEEARSRQCPPLEQGRGAKKRRP